MLTEWGREEEWGRLFALLHLSLESCESVVLTERSRSSLVLDSGDVVTTVATLVCTGSLAFSTSFAALSIFKRTAVREDDALAVLVELDYLESELLAFLSVRAVFLSEVLGSSETFNAIFELYNSTLVHQLSDRTFVNATFSEYTFEYVPRILFELLVTEREATVVRVDFENDNFDISTDLSEFRRMLNLLRPREVRDVDETIYTLFELYEHTEVREVTYLSVVT